MLKKRSNTHMVNMIIDFIHVGICLAVIVLAVLVFLGPTQHVQCYPVIFFLAAALNFTSGYARNQRVRVTKSKSMAGIASVIIGILFLILAAVSALTVLR